MKKIIRGIAVVAICMAIFVAVQLPYSEKIRQAQAAQVVEGQPEVPAQDEVQLDPQSAEVAAVVNSVTNEAEAMLNKLGYSLSNTVKVSVQ